MKHSNPAISYLNKATRDPQYVIKDRQEIVAYLKRQNIVPFDSVIDFQLNYSGLELTIPGKPGSTFRARLFSQTDLASNTAIEQVKIKGRSYFFCGDHETAPCWFVLSETGEICTYNNQDESVNPIFSSFQYLIENYVAEISQYESNMYEHPAYYNLKDNAAFWELVSNAIVNPKANDYFNHWSIVENNIRIHKGTWFDRPAAYIHIYGKSKATCEAFVSSLKAKGIIE